ncbi:MAG: cytochrome b [Bdellovibrionales bacterium GWB1_55_8]|nr:MAG: cytochrome b [Bdellovibrionales bacterium GWB1_55_8]
MKREGYVYLTPMPVRIWHWINALGIVTLCLTGIQIRFPEYIGVFGRYKNAIILHNAAGIVVTGIYLVWLIYYGLIARTLRKLYIPTFTDVKKGVFRQATYYLYHYFTGAPNPHHSQPHDKFNPMQKVAYLAIMFGLLPLVCASGVLLLNVAPLRDWVLMMGGIRLLVSAHFLIAASFTSFLFVHLYLATLGHTPLAHFKPMWTGWEKVDHESDRA